nr:MAG TPA: hypothetical protein [Caudoviricetes sp.]
MLLLRLKLHNAIAFSWRHENDRPHADTNINAAGQ